MPTVSHSRFPSKFAVVTSRAQKGMRQEDPCLSLDHPDPSFSHTNNALFYWYFLFFNALMDIFLA